MGIDLVVLSWVAAHYLSWRPPRSLQHALKAVAYPMQRLTLNRLVPHQNYSEGQISLYFWPNGKIPVREDWKRLAECGFRDFKLKVGGLVGHPVDLSLADIEKLGHAEHITMHHCIQGWIDRHGGLGRPRTPVVVYYASFSSTRSSLLESLLLDFPRRIKPIHAFFCTNRERWAGTAGPMEKPPSRRRTKMQSISSDGRF